MNIRVNKHRDGVFREDAILACRHYNQASHSFNEDAIFTIIEMLNDQSKDLTSMRKILEDREDFWIKKLITWTPFGFNGKLNRS